MNPDLDEIAKVLSEVQGRARNNLLTVDDAVAAYRRVVQQGEWSAHAGLKECPPGFKFGVSSTVIQVARLHESLIACSIGRQQVLPGNEAKAPISADPFEQPRRWLKEVVSTFWTRLDKKQIAALQKRCVDAALQFSRRPDQGDPHAHRVHRAAVKRELQLRALYRSAEPAYQSEFAGTMKDITAELRSRGQEVVTWRAFQSRWPSVAERYKRELLPLFPQGIGSASALSKARTGSAKYSLKFATWSGAQTVFSGTQIVFQVGSALLSQAKRGSNSARGALVIRLRDLADRSPHPVTPETVGWLRVHVDDLHRMVFVDEVQSDVLEHLLSMTGDAVAQSLSKEIADWHVEGFSSVRHWAGLIGYRVALHSEQSAMAIPEKTRSARKWGTYYGTLIKRFKLLRETPDGYPGPIFVEKKGGPLLVATSDEVPAA